MGHGYAAEVLEFSDVMFARLCDEWRKEGVVMDPRLKEAWRWWREEKIEGRWSCVVEEQGNSGRRREKGRKKLRGEEDFESSSEEENIFFYLCQFLSLLSCCTADGVLLVCSSNPCNALYILGFFLVKFQDALNKKI